MMEWLTLAAILIGPIAAVFITRHLDDRRFAAGRKMDIFRTLMRTRRIPSHVYHVGALNLVEVEFLKDEKVVRAWKDYLRNLGAEPPASPRQEGFYKERESLLTTLLSQIAVSLGLQVPQMDIHMGNYIP
jgi:hypothetical protein